ncbi:MAG: hypothetical protein IJK49_08695 [Prevotella sp.]|nr:hypothetical protein [Prevotella sp.]
MNKILLFAAFLCCSVSSFAQRDLGYRGMVDLSGGIGITPGSRFMVGLSTTHGYQATPFLFFGAGVAINAIGVKEGYEGHSESNDGEFYPIFGDIRIDIGSAKFSPFVDFRAGYSFISNKGLYLNPTIGAHYAKSENFGWNLGVGYEHQSCDGFFIDKNGKLKKSLGNIVLRVGIDF